MFLRASLVKEAKSLNPKEKLQLIANYLNSMEKTSRTWSIEETTVVSNTTTALKTQKEALKAEEDADEALFEQIKSEIQKKREDTAPLFTRSVLDDLISIQGDMPNSSYKHVIRYSEFSKDFDSLLACALYADKAAPKPKAEDFLNVLNGNAVDVAKAGYIKGQPKAPTSSSKLDESKHEFSNPTDYYQQVKQFNKKNTTPKIETTEDVVLTPIPFTRTKRPQVASAGVTEAAARKEKEEKTKEAVNIATTTISSPSASTIKAPTQEKAASTSTFSKFFPIKNTPQDTPEFNAFCEMLGTIPDEVLPHNIKICAYR